MSRRYNNEADAGAALATFLDEANGAVTRSDVWLTSKARTLRRCVGRCLYADGCVAL
jgi:hypothetical protein